MHPKALLEFDEQTPELKAQIAERIAAYASPTEFYVAKIVEGVATIAAAFAPKKVIVRLSDFKSNEYSNLIGGARYEPHEENPMLGFRGASRYIAPEFYDCFELECRAMKRVRDDMGLTNVEVMIPFVRTVGEAAQVIELLAKNGLARGENGLRVIMMCEIPSNALLADRFLEHFDGFSIGSNDMTQLTLAVDRDAGGAIALDLRRARRRGQGDAGDGDRGVPQGGEVRRHLRTGAVRPSRSRAVAGRAEDREHVAQSGYRRRDLARAGQASALRRRSSRQSADANASRSGHRPFGRLTASRAQRAQSIREIGAGPVRYASTLAHCRALTRFATIATAAMLALLPGEPWLRGACVLIAGACGIRALRRATASGSAALIAAVDLGSRPARDPHRSIRPAYRSDRPAGKLCRRAGDDAGAPSRGCAALARTGDLAGHDAGR